MTAIKWIRATKYAETTGTSTHAIHARRRRGQWIDGVHCVVAPDGNLYVNPSEADKWAESQVQPTTSQEA